MGRPTVLTREVIQKIAENIYPAGNYFEVACVLAGVSKTTGYEWLAMAEHRRRRRPGVSEELLSELSDAVNKANAAVENAMVMHWRKSASDDWHADAEFLARRFPERWKKIDRAELTGAGGKPVEFIEIDRSHAHSSDNDSDSIPTE